MTKKMPDWAVEPLLGIPAAARVLGLSPRKLSDVLKEFPCYQRGGRSYAFYPEHIKQLRAVLASLSPRPPLVSIAPTEPWEPNVFERALKLANSM